MVVFGHWLQEIIRTKALLDWLVHTLPNAYEPRIMKHMLLNGLKSCTAEISSQSQEHLIITSENRPSTSECSWVEPVNAGELIQGIPYLSLYFI